MNIFQSKLGFKPQGFIMPGERPTPETPEMLVDLGYTNNACVCEIPAGSRTKPQRHLFEELIFVLSGRGAMTVWQEGGNKQTFEWHEGSLFSPPLNAWHQHFNPGTEPARYLALRWGSRKYRRGEDVALRRDNVLKRFSEMSLKEGGGQIEYEEEDPQIYRMFQEECSKRGARLMMPDHPQAKT